MGIRTQKVLRMVSKIILILVGVGLIGIAGYYVYKSIAFKPQNVVVTNVTDGSATVTWTTSSPMKGIVYVKKDKALLPGPLGIIGSTMAYDDRDVSDAEKACVDEFNKTASETKDSTFSVSGSNFDCENVKVTKMGSYYNHSVTITNLDPESTYYFVAGDGIWSFKNETPLVKTFALLGNVTEPLPVFGKVIGDDDTYSRDGLVYITFNDGSEGKDSVVYSSTTSDDGGWYLDASGIRDSEGNVLPLELSNDTFRVKAKYSNYGESDEKTYVFGYFSTTTFDITVERHVVSTRPLWNKFVLSIYAGNETIDDCTNCPSWMDQKIYDDIKAGKADCKAIGYGNCLKVIAGSDKNLNDTEKALITDPVLKSNLDYVAKVQSVNYCKDGKYCTPSGSCKIVPGSCGAPAASGGEHFEDGCDAEKEECSDPGQCIELSAGNYKHCNKANTYCNYWVTNNTKCSADTGDDYTPTRNDCADDPGSNYCAEYCLTHSTDVLCGADSEDIAEEEDCAVTKVGSDDCTIRCGDYGEVALTSKNKCQRVYPGYNDLADGQTINVSAQAITPWILSEGRIGDLIVDSPTVKAEAIDEMKTCAKDKSNTGGVKGDGCEKICHALGGVVSKPAEKFTDCTVDGTSVLSSIFDLFHRLTQKTFAADSSENDTYSFYLPETGLYSFEIDGGQVVSQNTGGTNVKMFYIEANGQEGFQIPVDFENPTSAEDIVLSANAYEISYEQETTAQEYEISEGINIISFDFVPTSTDLGTYSAKDVISQASKDGVVIQYISTFGGGRWNNGYSCSSGTCTGDNFTIVPGKGYLVYATQDGTVTIPGYNLKTSIPVAFSAGWNLVGVHGYTTAYTARSFIDSINKIQGLTADNVSWWPTSKSKYEGLQVDNGTEYGLDFSMSPNNGYFVRVSKFAPTDTKCKSLIWNEGGSLNGTCGNTK